MSEPRITPVPVPEMEKEWTDILDTLPGDGLKGQNAPVNVMGTLMRQPELVGDFLRYWVKTKTAANLTAAEQELVILRLAWHYGSDYVWGHHLPPGKEAGVKRAKKMRVAGPGPLEGFGDRADALLAATDQLVVDRALDDPMYERLADLFTEEERLEFLHLFTQYVFFSLVNNTFRVELEPGIESLPPAEAAASEPNAAVAD